MSYYSINRYTNLFLFSVADNARVLYLDNLLFEGGKGVILPQLHHFWGKNLKSGSVLPICTCILVYFQAMPGSTLRKVGRTLSFGFRGNTVLTAQTAVTPLPVQSLEVKGFGGLMWRRQICLRHTFGSRRGYGERVAEFLYMVGTFIVREDIRNYSLTTQIQTVNGWVLALSRVVVLYCDHAQGWFCHPQPMEALWHILVF